MCVCVCGRGRGRGRGTVHFGGAKGHGLYGSRWWYRLSGGGVGREDQVKVKRY